MTASHEWQPPKEPRSDLGPIEGLEAIDLGDMTEAMRLFDEARKEMNLQITRIILGGGGDTKKESVGLLINLQIQASTQFGIMAAETFATEESHDEAIAAIATLYRNDEEQRIKILKKAFAHIEPDEEIKFEELTRTQTVSKLNEVLDDIKEELEDAIDPEQNSNEAVIEPGRYASHYADFYDEIIAKDFEKALDNALPNQPELHAIHHAMQRDRILGALGNLGMMVGASALTILGMTFIDKRRK